MWSNFLISCLKPCNHISNFHPRLLFLSRGAQLASSPAVLSWVAHHQPVVSPPRVPSTPGCTWRCYLWFLKQQLLCATKCKSLALWHRVWTFLQHVKIDADIILIDVKWHITNYYHTPLCPKWHITNITLKFETTASKIKVIAYRHENIPTVDLYAVSVLTYWG